PRRWPSRRRSSAGAPATAPATSTRARARAWRSGCAHSPPASAPRAWSRRWSRSRPARNGWRSATHCRAASASPVREVILERRRAGGLAEALRAEPVEERRQERVVVGVDRAGVALLGVLRQEEDRDRIVGREQARVVVLVPDDDDEAVVDLL